MKEIGQGRAPEQTVPFASKPLGAPRQGWEQGALSSNHCSPHKVTRHKVRPKEEASQNSCASTGHAHEELEASGRKRLSAETLHGS